MQTLKFSIVEQIIHLVCPARMVIADTKKHVFAEFELDNEWNGLSVTVVFSNDYAAPYSVPLTTNPMEIPPEVLVPGSLRVSLVGLRDNGEYRLTTKFMDRPIIIHRAGDLIGLQPEEASPELWEQVLALIGDVSSLDTSDKSSLVAAINELYATGGNSGAVSPDMVAALIKEYLSTTPLTSAQVGAHNADTASHADIRILIDGLAKRLNALADSDDTTLDQMSELVAYIKDNRELIDQVTTGKVSVTDIVNNLVTNVASKPLSAAQGVVLKTLIDALQKDKLSADALSAALESTLKQAKESGEFDGEPGRDGEPGAPGKDGTSVTITSVQESEQSGGTNVVAFSDGNTLAVKNGKDGTPGKDGKDGTDGKDGKDGEDGSDANVTAENIEAALGYKPANPDDMADGVHVGPEPPTDPNVKVWIDTDEDPEPMPKLTINGEQYDGTAPVSVETRPLYVAVTNTGGKWTIGNTLAEIEAAYQEKRPVGLTYSSATLSGNTYALNLVQRYSATDWLFGGIATAAINVLVRLSSSGNTETITTLAKQDQIPTALKNPNALTINGTSYDGSVPVEITVQGGNGASAQADWNAAEGEPGHILNRTHWSELVEVIPEQTVPGDEELLGYAVESSLVLVAGETYRVKFDGVVYDCTAWQFEEEGMAFVCLGNKMPMGIGDDTGEPFVVLALDGFVQFLVEELKPEVTLGISVMQYHKIPMQYLYGGVHWIDAVEVDGALTQITVTPAQTAEAIRFGLDVKLRITSAATEPNTGDVLTYVTVIQCTGTVAQNETLGAVYFVGPTGLAGTTRRVGLQIDGDVNNPWIVMSD